MSAWRGGKGGGRCEGLRGRRESNLKNERVKGERILNGKAVQMGPGQQGI